MNRLAIGIFNLLKNLVVGSAARANTTPAVEVSEEILIASNPRPTQKSNLEKMTDLFEPSLVRATLFPFTPLVNIQENLPLIIKQLDKRGIATPEMICYAIATVVVENDKFKPLAETASKWSTKGGKLPYSFSHYIGKGGNLTIEDANKYRGGGIIQLTLKDNYKDMDKKLDLDGGLLEHGYKALLDPHISAAVFAQYFADRANRIVPAIISSNYRELRRIVNGNAVLHLDKFTAAYKKAIQTFT